MANTSRKRPPPPPPSAAAASSSSTPQPCSIDALLAKYARHLPPGASISIQLIKGPTSSSVDPVAARKAAVKEAKRAAARAARMAAANHNNSSSLVVSSIHSSGMSSGNDDSDTNNFNTNTNAAKEGGSSTTTTTTTATAATCLLPFPRMAKFIETVTPPDFTTTLKDGRMYEEEVPKAKDESDEDESTNPAGNNGDSMNPSSESARNRANNNKNKKRRWRRFDPRPRRWVLQEKSEFFDKIRKRRMRNSGAGSVTSGTGDDGEEDSNGISNQYHGVVEANASKYVILSVAPSLSSSAAATATSNTTNNGMPIPPEKIHVQPIYGFHTFSQPYKFASLTMEEAEHAIEKQREVMSRYMMHGRMALQNSSNEAAAALQAGVLTAGGSGVGGGTTRGRGLSRSIGPPPKAMSRARLLGKLAGGGSVGGRGGGDDEDDDEDIMGDVRYSSSKVGGTSKGRKELLSSLGDEGVTADDDGVLGGANDSEFGGRRKFTRVSSAKDDVDATQGAKSGGGGGRNGTSTGFEAAAMEEGFYQRDVAAEYEALDYDAEEQFDDDDVNVGEDEMMDDGGGYGGDYHDSGDDNLLDSDDEDAGSGSDSEAFKGMATASGLKAMLAKARGESPVTASGFDSTNSSVAGTGTSALDTSFENLSGSISGAESTTSLSGMSEMMKKKPASPSIASSVAVVEKDKDGKRLITLEAVRREIWLNNGAITSKRLTKKFDVTKKNPERQALFKTIIMELCTIKKDADGNKLVLKQHYSKM